MEEDDIVLRIPIDRLVLVRNQSFMVAREEHI